MFNQVVIENFRGISSAKIDGLKNVNLFFGKNNCGKSSVLDAIFLISGPSNPALPININFFRGYNKVSRNDIRLDFYQLNDNIPIHLYAKDGEERDLSVSAIELGQRNVSLSGSDEGSISSQAEKRYGFKMSYTIDGNPFTSQLEIDASDISKAVTKADKKYNETIRCRYVSPKFDFMASILGLSNIIQNKDEVFILDALKLIEPTVRDFVIAGQDLLVDVGLKERIPINLLGDGARKIVALLTAVYDCKNGIVLVDEISNGFHYSVMTSLWETLLIASEKNNTQLFATTHDIDSIKGLIGAARQTKSEGRVSAYKLVKGDDGVIQSFPFSVENIDYALKQEIEIR